MKEWFVEKRGHNVGFFWIMYEGHLNHGMQKNISMGKQLIKDIMRCYLCYITFFTTCYPHLGNAENLNLHSDSYTGQKTNVVLGSQIHRVAHKLRDEILWHLMAVVHTKFMPDVVFGAIGQHVGALIKVLLMKQMLTAIEWSATSN